MVLRDQTESVRRKAERKKQKGRHENKNTEPDGSQIQWDSICVDGEVDPSAVDLILPRCLAENPQEFAIFSFFNQFVLVSFHPDGQRGFLDCLLPLYTATRHDSLLSVATAAVALTISGGAPWRKADFQLGRLMFGKALRMAAAAIQDPTASTEDETLMAVLLLGFYEVSWCFSFAGLVECSEIFRMYNQFSFVIILSILSYNLLSLKATFRSFLLVEKEIKDSIQQSVGR